MAKDSPEKLPELVQLVALERGYLDSRMIEAGAKFTFSTLGASGEPRKLPKWAQLATKPVPVKKATPADLKPTAAQNAVANKRSQLAGALPEGSADSVDKNAQSMA